jgi:predicted HicB family RNase H-like nuclease
MEYKGYVGRVEFDEDERVLHGRVDNIRSVVTFVADRAEDIEREFQLSVDEYLSFCAEQGIVPDQPYSGKFLVRVDPEIHRALAAAAASEEKSMNAWIAEVLGAAVAPTLATGKDPAATRAAQIKERGNAGPYTPAGNKPERKKAVGDKSSTPDRELPTGMLEKRARGKRKQ